MTREILFKAKRIDNGEWVEGYYIYHIKRTPCVFNDCVRPEDEQHVIMRDVFSDWYMPGDTIHYDIDPKTLCQYTGLTDKNGNKIWENDVVKYHFGDDVAAIKFGRYRGCFDSKKTCHVGFFVDWQNHMRKDLGYWVEMIDCNVIGNIFDNPELLMGV